MAVSGRQERTFKTHQGFSVPEHLAGPFWVPAARMVTALGS